MPIVFGANCSGMICSAVGVFDQINQKDNRHAVSTGLVYTLPMVFSLQAEMYHDGIVCLALMHEDIPVSRRL